MLPFLSTEINESPEQKAGHFSSADAVNALLVPNDSGKVDQLKIMDVAMENDSEISAFQFDWLLPDGFTVVADSCSLTDRSNGHGLSISYITSNTVRFISYSGSLKTYSGNSGALVQVALKPGPEVSPGVYPLQLQNVVLSDVTGKNVVTTVQNGQFRVIPETVYDTVFVTICNGETYPFGTETLTDSGEYTQTFTSSGGADSVVTLFLSVNPVFSQTIAASICEGETYSFGSQNLTTTGEYSQAFETVLGCDSVVKLNLTVYPTSETTVTDTIFNSESVLFGDRLLTEPGKYTHTFHSGNGCDSVVHLTLIKNINTIAEWVENNRFSLGQNFPNPFTGKTAIPFKLEMNVDEAEISVFDIMGRKVKNWKLENLNSGAHRVEWHADNRRGLFIYKMHIKQNGMRSYTQTRKMVIN